MRRAEVAERRARIAKLYLGGKSQPQISRELGIAQSTVSEDLNALVADWKRQAGVDIAARRAMELERLNGVEAQAWESFTKSCEPKKITSAGKRSDASGDCSSSTMLTLTTIPRPEGNPQFLRVVLQCIAERVKLLGLDFREPQDGRRTQPATLEEFVAAHLKLQPQNGNGSTPKAVRPATVELDPNRLP